MKRLAQQVSTELEALGYTYDTTTSKGDVYVRHGSPAVSVPQAVKEDQARQLLAGARRSCGVAPQSSKRQPKKVKARQQAARTKESAELARREADRARLIAQKDAILDGHGASLRPDQVREIEALIEAEDARILELHRLMAAPSNGGPQHARHESGQR